MNQSVEDRGSASSMDRVPSVSERESGFCRLLDGSHQSARGMRVDRHPRSGSKQAGRIPGNLESLEKRRARQARKARQSPFEVLGSGFSDLRTSNSAHRTSNFLPFRSFQTQNSARRTQNWLHPAGLARTAHSLADCFWITSKLRNDFSRGGSPVQ